MLLLVVTSVTHTEVAAGIFSDGVAPIAGIVTMLVNVRVGLGWAWGGSVIPSPPGSPSTEAEFDRWYTQYTLSAEVATSTGRS